MSRLWYDHPASEWEEALPIGNGRIGAMVYGGTDRERLQVNEESIWLGGPSQSRCKRKSAEDTTAPSGRQNSGG